jgi:[ribosomal protein S18]-alanine N-acetyltransferase
MADTSTADPLVRPFRVEDAAVVHELLKSSPEAAQWPLNAYEQLGELSTRGWVAETSGVVAGFILVRVVPPEAEILNLAVSLAWRRKGIATMLLAFAERTIRADSVSRVFLEVRESNQAGIAFYDRLGFARMGRRPAYYHDPEEAAVLMEKKLKG